MLYIKCYVHPTYKCLYIYIYLSGLQSGISIHPFGLCRTIYENDTLKHTINIDYIYIYPRINMLINYSTELLVPRINIVQYSSLNINYNISYQSY